MKTNPRYANLHTSKCLYECSLMPNCKGGGGVKLQILGKSLQVHLIIRREWPNSPLVILRYLDNSPLGAFYSLRFPVLEF